VLPIEIDWEKRHKSGKKLLELNGIEILDQGNWKNKIKNNNKHEEIEAVVGVEGCVRVNIGYACDNYLLSGC